MTGKEAILGRIREALKAKAPAPGDHGPGSKAPIDPPETDSFRQWLPRVGGNWQEQCNLFAANAAALKADFKQVSDHQEAAEEIRRIASQEGWSPIATHHSPLLDSIMPALGVDLLYTDQTYATAELEKCGGGVSTCEALIAQTGSVLVTSLSCGGRAISVLPPHHVVVATKEQLIPDLTEAFRLLRRKYEGNYPSMMSFITGPSRTGDIERILVLGAHGPKQLTILLLG